MKVVKVRNAETMMVAVVPRDEGLSVEFADGRSGVVPFKDIPEVGDRGGLYDVELPNPYEIILVNIRDEKVEIPWDFARHYCDPNYRVRMEALTARSKRILGDRVREMRESAGKTPGELVESANIPPGDLEDIERGKQAPRLATLKAIAVALGRPVEDLLAGAP